MNGFVALNDYYERDWSKRKENVWRSFTMWACLYDWVKESHLTLDELGIYDIVVDQIQNDSGANRDWIEYLWDDVLVELVDISFLWGLMEDQENEYVEEQKSDLFDELDDEEYKSRDEVLAKVEELMDWYYLPDERSDDLTDDYIDDRGLDFEEMLYDYLDWYDFVNKTEILCATQDYFFPDAWTDWEQPSYWDIADCQEKANKYIEDREIKFDEEENIINFNS